MSTIPLSEIEIALAAGAIKVKMRNGNLWSVRRNGKTQTWKTRPGEFRIPVKYGFRGYGALTQHCTFELRGALYIL